MSRALAAFSPHEERAVRSVAARQWPSPVDGAVVVAVAVYAIALAHADGREQRAMDFVMLSLTCLVLLFRHSAPVVTLTLSVCIRVWQHQAGAVDAYVTMALFVTLFTVASERQAAISIAGLVSVSTIFVATSEVSWTDIGLLGSTVGYLGAAVACGISVRCRQQLNDRLDRQAREVAEEAAERETTAVERERARLRDDLHDVLGHHLNLTLVLAQSAAVAAESDRTHLTGILTDIEDTSRSALAEMDRTTRRLQTSSDVEPVSVLANCAKLSESLRNAGIAVEIAVTPSDASLADLDLATSTTSYSVVQEALTNVVKHSAERWARVEIALDDSCVSVMVRSGRAKSATSRRGGTGLVSLRRRVGLLGGRLETRDDAEGYECKAVIPWNPQQHP